MKPRVTSENTKKMFANALKGLLKKKKLSQISVKELVEICGVNRKTFYYHFEDIYALLKWTLEQEAINLFDRYDLINEHTKAIEFALDYIESNLDVLKNIVRSLGGAEIRNFFFNDIYEPMHRLVCTVAQNRN